MIAVLGLFGACSQGGAEGATASATSPKRPTTSTTTLTAPAAPTRDTGFPDGWTPPTLDWADCDLPRNGRCASLEVPLDWDDPEGPTIRLRLGRVLAEGNRIGSLLVNPGGPGGSGLEFLSYDPVSPDLADRFDLVSWDPRGVGDSTAVQCGDQVDALLSTDPDPDDAAEQAALDTAAAAVSAECAAEDADLLAHLGTDDVARDMEAIRRALGDDQLSYLGFSYGTQIGQTYAEMFPQRVRAMVLDGVVDPSLGFREFLLGQAAAFEAAFDRGVESCAAAGAGSCGVGDLGTAYDRVKARVEQRPLSGGDRPVGPSELATAAIQTSYGQDGWRDLGPALAAALDGDGGPLWDLASDYYDFGGFTSYAAVVCIDTPPPAGAAAYRAFADEARTRSPRFGGPVANELASCATWPAAPVGDAAPVRADGAPPILVVGNTGDAATPYQNAVDVAAALASGVLLTVELGGHTAYGSDTCASAAIDDYLVELTLPEQGTVCGG
jgi:pimeloyl-ACP methyl ester carboxylesterase